MACRAEEAVCGLLRLCESGSIKSPDHLSCGCMQRGYGTILTCR